jgi:octaprenyl-diphosphate synthase
MSDSGTASGPDHPLAGIAQVFEHLSDALALVERTLRAQLPSQAELIRPLGEHVLSSGGKRMRPALLMLTADLCGYTGPRRIQIAAALELLHTATLVHDDVVDMSDLRRGRPSANAVWGNRKAVLAGDFLYARASSMVVEDGSMEIVERFADTVRMMAEGELLQLQFSFDVAATEAQYYAVIDRKSAALLSTACECGAILGGVTRAERRSLAMFGRELGLAFQLRDDALDYQASSTQLGKHRYTDLREGKVTLPLLLTLKRCTGSERELVAGTLKRARQAEAEGLEASDPNAQDPVSEESFAAVVELTERYRGVVDTARRAEEHVARGRDAIAAYPDGYARRALLSAAEYAATRTH